MRWRARRFAGLRRRRAPLRAIRAISESFRPPERLMAAARSRTVLGNDHARALLHPLRGSDPPVDVYSEAPLPTRHGLFRVVVFRERGTDKEHVAAVKGEVRGRQGVPVRVHSECLTSEI